MQLMQLLEYIDFNGFRLSPSLTHCYEILVEKVDQVFFRDSSPQNLMSTFDCLMLFQQRDIFLSLWYGKEFDNLFKKILGSKKCQRNLFLLWSWKGFFLNEIPLLNWLFRNFKLELTCGKFWRYLVWIKSWREVQRSGSRSGSRRVP